MKITLYPAAPPVLLLNPKAKALPATTGLKSTQATGANTRIERILGAKHAF